MSDDAVLSLENVTKVYGTKVVLDCLDLSIPVGSVVGLLGKNGAGKTTLIKCALGLLKPQSGELSVFGESAWDLSAQVKARLGYVAQVPELYAWMKMRQIIAYTASFYPRWNYSKVDRLTKEWELPLEDRVGPLSVGTKQKLAILLAIGHEPDLLVLDEPAASLDPAARREFLAAVLQIADSGRRTVLFSTHITSDLERVADRVAILKDGKIICHEELDTLKDQVKRVVVRAARPLPERIDLPGILRQRTDGCEAVLTLAKTTPELLSSMETQWQASVEVQNLNLEDIFLEMHGG